MSSVKLDKRSSVFNHADGNRELINKQADSNGKDFYKILFDCTKDIYVYKQFIFYVGTSCDSKTLRIKISCLEVRILENINLQKDKIFIYLKDLLHPTDKTKKFSEHEQEEIERYMCFALSTLAYLETLLEKLLLLLKLFPLVLDILHAIKEGKNEFINLGFDDNILQEYDELYKKTTTTTSINMQVTEGNSDEKSLINDTNKRLKEIQHLKEEIEHVDVNLIRFNVKKASELFISRIQAFNNDEPSHTIVKINEPIVSNKKISSVKKEFSCCLKLGSINFWNRYKCAIFLIVLSVVTIVGIACGLVFGLSR